MGLKANEVGIPYYTQKFVVGYDDLVEKYPIKSSIGADLYAIKRYGKNFIVSCRIKAWDALYVDPGAMGKRTTLETVTDTAIKFNLRMYTDDTFKTKFDDGELVNLDAETPIDETTIYVEASADITNQTVDWMIHLKKCSMQDKIRIFNAETEEFGEWIFENEYEFLVDGMLTTDQFTNRNIGKF